MKSTSLENESQKKKNSDSQISEICFTIFLYLIIAVLFGYFTSEPKYYGGDGCVELLRWGKNMFHLYLLGVALTAIVIPISFFCSSLCKSSPFCIYYTTMAMMALKFALLIISIIFFVLLWQAYAKNEPCGDLRTLSFIYILLVAIGLGVLCFVLVCCLCCTCCLG